MCTILLGEVAQVCKEMGLKCLVVQISKEKAEMVMAHLGIDPAPTESEEESEVPMDTEGLLDDLTKAGTKSEYIRRRILSSVSGVTVTTSPKAYKT